MNGKCPRDGAALVERNDGRASFLHCKTCGGIQVAFDELLEVRPTPRGPLDGISFESLPIDDTATCSCFGEPLMKTLERDGVSIESGVRRRMARSRRAREDSSGVEE